MYDTDRSGDEAPERSSFSFSTGIERIFLKSLTDENFRENLLKNREDALSDLKYPLTPQDKMLLKSIPHKKLEDMISRFNFQRTSRRNFLKGAAATVALLATGCISNKPEPSYPDSGGSFGCRPEPTPVVLTSQKVGPGGAIIKYKYNNEQLQLIIPEGALDVKEEIIVKIPLYSPSEKEGKSDIYYFPVIEFCPEKLALKKEIDIYLPLADINYSQLKGYYIKYEPPGLFEGSEVEEFEEMPLEIEDGYAVIKTKKPGIYTVGYTMEKTEGE